MAEFVAAAHTVSEVAELQGSLFQYRMRDERDSAIHDLRLLRERSAGLLAMAANEPNLILNVPTAEATPFVAERGGQLQPIAA